MNRDSPAPGESLWPWRCGGGVRGTPLYGSQDGFAMRRSTYAVNYKVARIIVLFGPNLIVLDHRFRGCRPCAIPLARWEGGGGVT